jgi:hypothetical protein
MDFKDSIKQIAERIAKLKDNLPTEEATKNALIMPFIQALGYDVFNPLEVLPEMSCDIGTKKGEKIDYAIMKDGIPVMLVECKHWAQDLNLHDNQLLRYFNVSKAKFGVLTNGIIYRFYTDLDAPNKMDEKPFLEVDLLDIKGNQIEELKKFHKTYFDVEKILSSASELKYTGEIKAILNSEFANPSPEFVRFLAKQVYGGMITAKILDQFTTLVKRSVSNLINEIISDRLKTALENEEKKEEPKPASESMALLPEGVVYMSEDGTIVTTQEEIDGFNIVRAILYGTVDLARITYRDAQSYFAILFDDNNRKTICRLYFNSPTVKYISVFDSAKKEIKHKIETLGEIYKCSKEIKEIVNFYMQNQHKKTETTESSTKNI